MRTFLTIFLFLFTFFPISSFAQDANSEQGWKSNAGINALITSGNSENQTLGGDSTTSYRRNMDKVELKGTGAYGRAKDNTTGVTTTNTKNWRIGLRYDRFINEAMSFFGLGHIGADQPAGFDLRYGGSAGFSHQILNTDPTKFKYELGFDYTKENRVAAPNEDIYSGRVFLEFKQKISDWSEFLQNLEYLQNVETAKDVRLNSFTGVTASLSKSLALQAGYEVRFDNDPVPGKKKTDTTTKVGLVINFL